MLLASFAIIITEQLTDKQDRVLAYSVWQK